MTQSVEHFTKSIDQLTNKDGTAYEWSTQLQEFTAVMNKFVLGHPSSIPVGEMSYKDLSAALPGILEGLPATIDGGK